MEFMCNCSVQTLAFTNVLRNPPPKKQGGTPLRRKKSKWRMINLGFSAFGPIATKVRLGQMRELSDPRMGSE